jgi:hypothetical protein
MMVNLSFMKAGRRVTGSTGKVIEELLGGGGGRVDCIGYAGRRSSCTQINLAAP